MIKFLFSKIFVLYFGNIEGVYCSLGHQESLFLPEHYRMPNLRLPKDRPIKIDKRRHGLEHGDPSGKPQRPTGKMTTINDSATKSIADPLCRLGAAFAK